MDYFSPQTILICGVIIGIALTLSLELALNELAQQRRK